MIKYRLYILAVAYIAIILGSFLALSSRGCYTHKTLESPIANLTSAKFYYYSKKSVTADKLKRGDVIIYRLPGTTRETAVRRILGLPGDQVAFADGAFQVNGTPHQPSFLAAIQIPVTGALPPVSVPQGTVYVIPDNLTGFNLDSRDAFVPLCRVKGKFIKSLFKDESF